MDLYRAQGFDYRFPDLNQAQFVEKLVLENGSGRPSMALAARATAEMYLLIDQREGTPQERWEQFKALHRAMEGQMYGLGFEDVHAWLPPTIAKRFGRRLEGLGWRRDDQWTPYCKYLEAPNGQGQ